LIRNDVAVQNIFVGAESARFFAAFFLRVNIKFNSINVLYRFSRLAYLVEYTMAEGKKHEEVQQMKTKQMMVMGLAALCAMALAGEASARGGNGGGAKGQGMRSGTCAQSGTAGATRPAGSQRRDGTFMTTGTTANGSTTRQGKGNGLQDGSHMTGTTAAPAPSTTAAP
jgi:hypothetical protein